MAMKVLLAKRFVLWTFFVDAESNSGERSRASFYQYRYCERHQEGCQKGIQAHAKA
ncbi:hypothetical protein ABH995_001182 [Bradyrhizobium yuanmingense]